MAEHFHARGTSFVFVSRGPLAKLQAYRKRMGWNIPWYSSAGSDFNQDFQVASSERVFRLKYTVGAVASTDASTATHSSPRWCACATSAEVPRNASRHPQSARLSREARRRRYDGA